MVDAEAGTSRRAYLDASAISRIVKQDAIADELDALDQIIAGHRDGRLQLVRSRVVHEEIRKVPAEHRKKFEDLDLVLKEIPLADPGPRTRLGLWGAPVTNPYRRLWEQIEATLKDPPDREHVYAAATNRVRFLITFDRKTILNKRKAVQDVSGVITVTAVEFLRHPECPL